MTKAIYTVTNKVNGKTYVGQSNNPEYRWKQHCQRANNPNYQERSALYPAMRKYGIENFEFTILGWFEDYNEKEKYYIKELNTLSPNGYNLAEGGEEPPHFYGEEHPNSLYKQEVVDNIIDDLLSKQYTQKQIELKYGVNQQLVTSINRGVTHRREGVIYPILIESKYHCNDEQIDKIRFLLKNSLCTCEEIGKYFNFSKSTIKAINSGKNHHCDDISYPIRKFRGQSGVQSIEQALKNWTPSLNKE